jgi:hypothetical protein
MRSLLIVAVFAFILIAGTPASLARSSSSSSGTWRYPCPSCNTHEHLVHPRDGRAPYWRTNPNSTPRDNFSCKLNINPHNGKPGTKSC